MTCAVSFLFSLFFYHVIVEIGGGEANDDRVVGFGLGDAIEFLEGVGFKEQQGSCVVVFV